MLGVAVASLALLGYTYLGYPLLIGILARLFPMRVAVDPGHQPAVTVCIAAYNVAAYLDAKLRSLMDQDYPADKVEILVYSDGSTDATDDVVRGFAARDGRIRLIRGDVRSGKPTALNRMREAARGELLLITDSRQPLAPGALSALCAMMIDLSVGAVTGNLILRGPAGSGFYWRYETWIRRHEARFRSVVGMTGPVSIVRAADLAPLPDDVILDDVLIPMRLRLRRRKVLFCEAARAYDDAFADGREFGRKVRTLAGNYQIFRWMPQLLLPFVNPSWFETLSHKALRLVCPWGLVALFAASLAGAAASEGAAGALLRLLLVCQLAFYAAAAVGPRGGRVAGVARTFVVLHAAAVVGLWRHLTGRQKITW